MHALSVRGLTKTYRNGVQALKGIDLDVEEGDFFALLGPNGAGKTTLIGIVTSLVNKTGGTVSVFGHDIDRDLDRAKSCIGIVPQEINFNMFESPETIVVNQAGFYGMPRGLARERAEKYLKQLQLWDKRKRWRALAVRRHEAPADDRARADARAAAADPRRAHRGRGHRDPPLDVGVPARDQRAAAPPSSSRRITWKRPRASAATSPSSTAGASSSATGMSSLLRKLQTETFVLNLRSPVAAAPVLAGYARDAGR